MNQPNPYNYPSHGHPNQPHNMGGYETFVTDGIHYVRHGKEAPYNDSPHTERIAEHVGRVGMAEAVPPQQSGGENTPGFNFIRDALGDPIVITRIERGTTPSGFPITESRPVPASREQRAAINRHEVTKKMRTVQGGHGQRPNAANMAPQNASNTPRNYAPAPQNFGDQAPSQGAFDYNQPPVGGFGPQKGATKEFRAQQATQQQPWGYPTGDRRRTAAEASDDYSDDYEDPRLGLARASSRRDSTPGTTAETRVTPTDTQPGDEELAPWQRNETWTPLSGETSQDDSFDGATYGVKPVVSRGAAIPGSQQAASTEQKPVSNQLGGAAAAEAADRGLQADEIFRVEEDGDATQGDQTREEQQWATISPTRRKRKTEYE